MYHGTFRPLIIFFPLQCHTIFLPRPLYECMCINFYLPDVLLIQMTKLFQIRYDIRSVPWLCHCHCLGQH